MVIVHFLHSRYYPKTTDFLQKKVQKNSASVCFNEVVWLIAMKLNMKMNNRSHRYDLNRPRPRHGHRCTQYKTCLSIMIVTCIKQHLSTIWSSIHQKVKQHWGWVQKKRYLSKKASNEFSAIGWSTSQLMLLVTYLRLASSIWYTGKIVRKTIITYRLLIHQLEMLFWKSFAYVLNGWSFCGNIGSFIKFSDLLNPLSASVAFI